MGPCRRSSSCPKSLAILCTFTIVQLFLGVWVYFRIPPFILTQIRKEFAVVENSAIYDIWLEPPVQPLMKLRVFNVTNLKAWLAGKDEVMAVQEVGPFVYRSVHTCIEKRKMQ